MAPDAGLKKVMEAVQAAVEAFDSLNAEERRRALQMFLTALGATQGAIANGAGVPGVVNPATPAGGFSTSPLSITPPATPAGATTARTFVTVKKPKTDEQRVACLAYYFTHYQSRPSFRARELEELGTSAALKFSNIRVTISNATRQSKLLTPAGPKLHQITPRGEAVVNALPDSEAVRVALQEYTIRTRKKRPGRPRKSKASQ